MILKTFPSGPFETNAYVVVCSKTNQAVIIDPAPDSFTSIVQFIEDEQLTPIALWLTHSHWDHIADAAPLIKKYHLPVYIHPLDAPNLTSPGADKLPCWIRIEGVTPTHLLKEGETLTVGDLTFIVIHTPGHTPGGVCFYSPKEKVLISGDTLFKGTIGNLSFPTSVPDQMWPSLAKLAKLPPDTSVYPGHGDPTMIGSEKWLGRAKEVFGNY